MSIWIRQAPVYFQQLIHEALRHLGFAFGYLDDILVFTPSVETKYL